MSHRYCKYCVTELRSFKTCHAGVCSYCWDNPKRRARFEQVKQERTQQQRTDKPFRTAKELDERLKELESERKRLQAKHEEMFKKKRCVKCGFEEYLLLDSKCTNCLIKGL